MIENLGNESVTYAQGSIKQVFHICHTSILDDLVCIQGVVARSRTGFIAIQRNIQSIDDFTRMYGQRGASNMVQPCAPER